MKYLYETHFHTSEVSPCGNVCAADGVRMYKAAGYSGVMVTDHISTAHMIEDYAGKDWKESTDSYLKGYHIAKKHSADDFSVMLGMEVRLDENDNDYLVFGVTEEFIYENEWFTKLSIKQFKKLCEKNELTLIHAHPFRKDMTVNNPRNIDGVEVFNGNRRHDSSDRVAALWAETHELIKTSGSDFHENEDLARGGMYFSDFITDSKELRSAILKGGYTLKTLD